MILTCPRCGQKNRVPAERLDQGPSCGQCKATLQSSKVPVEVDDRELEAAVQASPLPVVVDFWAPWCGPCRVVAPEVARLAAERADQVLVLKLNTQDNPAAAQRYNVQGIPMFGLFRGGQLEKRAVGAMGAEQLAAELGL